MNLISGVIITYNEAQNIERCIVALQKVCDEIIVIDSFSKDKTVEIAQNLGAKIYSEEWKGYSKAKNLGNKLAKNDWILSIDADEVVSDELVKNINNLKLDTSKIYRLDRHNYFCGQRIKYCGWSPDWKLRLFHRETARWTGDFVHEKMDFDNNLTREKLKGALLHYSYDSADEHLLRIEKYSQLAAEDLFKKKKQISVLKKTLKPVFEFFKTYIIKLGFLDGKYGLLISKRNALFLRRKYSKLEELWVRES